MYTYMSYVYMTFCVIVVGLLVFSLKRVLKTYPGPGYLCYDDRCGGWEPDYEISR